MDAMNIQFHSTKSDIETQEVLNNLVKESIEIITEELEYFYFNKERLIDLYVDTICVDEIKSCILNEFFNKCYSSGELTSLIERMERQIKRQVGILQYVRDFTLVSTSDSLLGEPETLNEVREEIRTLKLNQAMVKLVDLAWKNTCKAILPLSFFKHTSKFKPGEALLATIGLSPKEIRNDIKVKFARRLKGALKQHKTELSNMLTQKIILQILTQQHFSCVEVELVKTA